MSRTAHVSLALLLLVGVSQLAHGEIPIPEDPSWTPVVDKVYLQEAARRIETKDPLLAVAVPGDTVYVGDGRGVYRVDGDGLVAAGGPKASVQRLRAIDGTLWAACAGGVWRFAKGEWTRMGEGPFVDVCEHIGTVVAASQERLYRVAGGKLEPLNAKPCGQPILGVQSYSETLYVRHAGEVGVFDGARFEYENVADWNELPLACQTRDMLTLGSRLTVATDNGLGVLRGMSWHTVQGEDGLCYEDTTCVAAGFANDYWVGTTRGAIRAVDGEFHYYGYERWVPHDKVNAIAVGGRNVYIATDGGLGVIDFEPFTLQKKSAWYKRYVNEWGMRRLGFVNVLSRQADGTYIRNLGDNDVGWLCHYLNGLCFEYAVTRDPEVRAEAVDVFKTVKWSEEITPIAGYPARAIYAVGEPANQAKTGSAGRPAEWNPTEDRLWEWKGDTSSDEVVAQIYSVSVFHDLVAEGIEKEKAVEHLERIIGHIVDNGWLLRDIDGKPTVWGRWDPEFIYSPLHRDERGLNSLQALSFAAVANRLFPSPKFERARRQLIEWGYVNNVLRQKITFPYYTRFDDRLAFLSFYPLLRYETDPAVRGPVMRSLQRSWEIKRIENQTWFNYIYGALTGNDCENAQAVDFLRAFPLDTVGYACANSHRDDLQNPRGYINYLENWRPLTARDAGWHRWNRSFQELDRGGSRNISDPTGWLDAYWMGRYYGFILPPDTEDPSLLTVEQRDVHLGAEPYDGPPRPEIF